MILLICGGMWLDREEIQKGGRPSLRKMITEIHEKVVIEDNHYCDCR